MADYINREKAIAEIDKGDLLVGDNAKWAKEILYRTPTEDIVPVVRCKDCKHFNVGVSFQSKPILYCRRTKFSFETKPDDYCSYGERKCDDGKIY